jgi:hypothetical protein
MKASILCFRAAVLLERFPASLNLFCLLGVP